MRENTAKITDIYLYLFFIHLVYFNVKFCYCQTVDYEEHEIFQTNFEILKIKIILTIECTELPYFLNHIDDCCKGNLPFSKSS